MNSVNILSLETSAIDCSVALSRDETLVQEINAEKSWSHSREITLLISRLMESNSLEFADLQAIAISKGPGSYTGLRVACSVAKAICYARKLPLIAVNTLRLITEACLEENGAKDFDFIIPMIDARRDEVYYQIFDASLQSQNSPDNLILDTTAFKHLRESSRIVICGDAATKAKALIRDDKLLYFPYKPRARHMRIPALQAFRQDRFEDVAYFQPFYLKPPNITRSKKPLF